MSIWTEVKETLLRFSETALNKTEILTQMAKCKINARSRESEIDKILIEIGNYTVSQVEKNENISNDVVQNKIEKINSIRSEIADFEALYNEARSKLVNREKPQPEDAECEENKKE